MAKNFKSLNKFEWKGYDSPVQSVKPGRSMQGVVVGTFDDNGVQKNIFETIYSDILTNNKLYDMSANVTERPVVTVKLNGRMIGHNDQFDKDCEMLTMKFQRLNENEQQELMESLKKGHESGVYNADAQMYKYSLQKETGSKFPFSFDFLYEVIVVQTELRKAKEAKEKREREIAEMKKPLNEDIGKFVNDYYEDLAEIITMYDKKMISVEETKDKVPGLISKFDMNKVRSEFVRLTWNKVFDNVR